MEEQYESPLRTDQGDTQISKAVVSRIVGLACQGVEGVFMGGAASRQASGLMNRASRGDSNTQQDETRGVTVQVGRVETAVDLDLALAYGVDLPQTTETLRSRIRDRVENLVGLRVREINVTVKDIVFPEEDEEGRRKERRAEDDARSTVAMPAGIEGQEAEYGRYGRATDTTGEPGSGREATERREAAGEGEPVGEQHQASTREKVPEERETATSRQDEETSEDREEVRVEGEPLKRGEGADLDAGEEDIQKYLLEREKRSDDDDPSNEDDDTRRRRRR